MVQHEKVMPCREHGRLRAAAHSGRPLTLILRNITSITPAGNEIRQVIERMADCSTGNRRRRAVTAKADNECCTGSEHDYRSDTDECELPPAGFAVGGRFGEVAPFMAINKPGDASGWFQAGPGNIHFKIDAVPLAVRGNNAVKILGEDVIVARGYDSVAVAQPVAHSGDGLIREMGGQGRLP